MTLECVNKGGPGSFIRLSEVPRLERPVSLSADAAAALGCWQARAGDILTVVDPAQVFYRARLVEDEAGQTAVIPFQSLARPPESPLVIEVYQALPEKERFELILQKLTEIGVSRIVPYVSRRSSTLAERDAGQKKSHRWPDVVLRAAKQCRRGMLPELFPVVSWDEATYRVEARPAVGLLAVVHLTQQLEVGDRGGSALGEVVAVVGLEHPSPFAAGDDATSVPGPQGVVDGVSCGGGSRWRGLGCRPGRGPAHRSWRGAGSG